MIVVHRTALRRRVAKSLLSRTSLQTRWIHQTTRFCRESKEETDKDPRISPEGDLIQNDFATLRENYQTPKHAIVLAHGLFGFDKIRPVGGILPILPAIEYWSGVEQALAAKGVEVDPSNLEQVITATVPPAGRIEDRAQRLAEDIEGKANGKAVNIVAGLDARHMLSRLKPPNVSVLSLTTIATPHRGSEFADFIFTQIGPTNIPKVYKMLEYFGFETGAFRQLTKAYMAEKFNPRTPDVEGIRYYSYGASLHPQFTSVFRQSQKIIERAEGENDGLVSVESSRWGTYKGTLQDVSHLDLINWTNKLRWYLLMSLTGKKRNFNAIAFYLGIADMLAREGL